MKRILFALICVVFFFSFSFLAAAEEQYSDDFRNAIDLEDSLLSDETDLNQTDSIKKDLEFKNIFAFLWRQIRDSFGGAVKTLSMGISLILLSALLNRCNGNVQSQNLHLIYTFIVTLSVILICEQSLRNCAGSLQSAIGNMNVFINACIPSFSVVMIAAGEGGSASAFSAALLFLGEIGALISNYLLMPLTDVYLSVGICSAISDEYNFKIIAKNIRKFIYWFVGVFIAVFRVILRLQSAAAAAGDRITQKYIRAALGSLIPVVGGTLSQGVDGLFAVASGIKSTFAIAGVLIVLSIMLPVLVEIAVYGICWSFCKWVAGFMNDSTVHSVASILSNCFYLMLALSGCVTLMGLFSFFGIITQLG